MTTQSNPLPIPELLAVPAPFGSLPPFRIEPIFDPRIWGRKSLRPWFPVDTPDKPIGEVWLTGDECVAATGPAKGQTLASLADLSPRAFLGHDLEPTQLRNTESANHVATSNSPLLIKLLFPQDKLSVQVHPDDELAVSQGFPRGKTECWYVLDADPNAAVALGFKPGLQDQLTPQMVRDRALDGSLESSLNILPIAAGDMIFVDAGTVHALFPGSVLLEVQENSDTTYRLFDYGRPRQLHLEKSLEALKFITKAGKIPRRSLADRTLLISTDFFVIELFTIASPYKSQTFRAAEQTDQAPDQAAPALSYLFLNKGSALITPLPDGPQFAPIELPEHSILAIPAHSTEFLIQPHSEIEFLRIQSLVR